MEVTIVVDTTLKIKNSPPGTTSHSLMNISYYKYVGLWEGSFAILNKKNIVEFMVGNTLFSIPFLHTTSTQIAENCF